MELTHRFSVPARIDVAWSVLTSPDLLGPCFPGAVVAQVSDDARFTGSIKVKLGPAVMTFDGSGEYLKRNADQHSFVVTLRGNDRRGQGGGAAVVTARLRDTGADTEVVLLTKITLSGKPAQLGRAVVEEATGRLLDQCVGCLSAKLREGLSSGQSPTGAQQAQLVTSGGGPVAGPGRRMELATSSRPRRMVLAAVAAAMAGLVQLGSRLRARVRG